MNVNERIADICKLTGFKEDVVRRVLEAEGDSLAKSLASGEKSVLLGMCTFIPSIGKRLLHDENGNTIIEDRATLTVTPSKSLLAKVNKVIIENNGPLPSEEVNIPHLASLQIEGLV